MSILPLTQDSHHFFNESKFNLMSETAVFVNIGRGPTVKEDDLIKALENKNIGGAILDVFEKEPLDKESKLWGLENVLMTPHSADLTGDYFTLGFEIFKKEFLNYSSGKPLTCQVNKKKGY